MFFIPNPALRDAACKDLDEQTKRNFFDGGGTRTYAAQKFCRRNCTVREACLQVALDFEGRPGAMQRHGVWGGLTADERNEIYGPVDTTEVIEPVRVQEPEQEFYYEGLFDIELPAQGRRQP